MERAASSLRWRAAFAATLAIAMGISPFAVFAIGALAPFVVVDLGLTRAAIGSLATLGFGVAAVSSVVGGRTVDHRDPRTSLVLLLASGGTAVAIMSAATSLHGMWAAAGLAGLGLGLANPITNRLIAEYIPAGRRGLQTGIKQSGVSMMQAIAGIALPALALLVGWRVAILVGVVLAALAIVSVLVVIPRSEVPVSRPRRRTGLPQDQAVRWMTVYALLIAMTTPTALVYASLYAFERLGYSAAVAGLATGVLGVAGMTARMLWGFIAERWASPRTALGSIALVAAASITLVAASEHLAAWLVWPGLVGFGISAMAANAVLMLAVISGSGPEGTGRSTGFVNVGLFVGRTVGPLAFGVMIDRSTHYSVGWIAVATLCLGAFATTALWRRAAVARA